MKRAKKESRDEGTQRRNKEDGQCRYYWTWWRVRVTTTAMETQLCLLCVMLNWTSLSATAMLSAAQNCFYGECVSLATTKRTWVFMQSVRYFCPNFTKFGVSQQIFVKVPSIKLHENPSSGSRVDICGRTYRQTDGYEEVNRRFPTIRENS